MGGGSSKNPNENANSTYGECPACPSCPQTQPAPVYPTPVPCPKPEKLFNQGPCPKKNQAFAPWDASTQEYFCYDVNFKDAKNMHTQVCSVTKDPLDPKLVQYLPPGGKFGTDRNLC